MIAVIDSGSTKTHWCFATEEERETLYSPGMNALTPTEGFSRETVPVDILTRLQQCQAVYFYGAGVSNHKIALFLVEWLCSLTTADVVEVASDLLGAARSAFQDQNGIMAIMGTGSNAGYFNGKEMERNPIPSLGYILGDEGSGTDLGKCVLRAYYYNSMPSDVREEFKAIFKPDLQQILHGTYRMPQARQFIGKYASLLSQTQNRVWAEALIKQRVKIFIETRIIPLCRDASTPFAMTGTIAWMFSSTMEEILSGYGISIHQVSRYPLDGLVNFHLNTK